MSAAAATTPAAGAADVRRRSLPAWWPLLALTLLAAVLRLATLGEQSFWYDEAFTPVHVLHPSLSATLHAVAHTENSPPLWYLIAWLFERIFGDGEVSLRLPSALAGIAAVPVMWALGAELAGRRAAIAGAALTAVSPLFVWYSQEARTYALFALTAALALLCFARAVNKPTRRRLWQFALAAALCLLSHYFAVFLLAPMCVWLLLGSGAQARRTAVAAVGAVALVGAALVPLIIAQGGHGTQWIGRWPLSERLAAIPDYFLTGASGEPLGHGIELLVALPLVAAALIGLLRLAELSPRARAAEAPDPVRGAALAALPAACGLLVPVALVAFGADYLAPRNLIGAMVAVTALLAVLGAWRGAGTAAATLLAIGALGLLAISVDVDLSPRLQRGDWRGLAHALANGGAGRVITTVQLGSAPLQYYVPGLRPAAPGSTVLVREIDETGYAPLRASALAPPAPGFTLVQRLDVHGLIALRFVAPSARAVAERTLRAHVITLAHASVLVLPGTASGP